MTLQQLINSGNKTEIAKVLNKIDEAKQKDLEGKLLVIKAYLTCKGIAIILVVFCVIKYWHK